MVLFRPIFRMQAATTLFFSGLLLVVMYSNPCVAVRKSQQSHADYIGVQLHESLHSLFLFHICLFVVNPVH